MAFEAALKLGDYQRNDHAGPRTRNAQIDDWTHLLLNARGVPAREEYTQ